MTSQRENILSISTEFSIAFFFRIYKQISSYL